MDDMNTARLVRIGKVHDVKPGDCTARVKFDDLGMVSGWLHVLQHKGGALTITPDGKHTHGVTVSDTYTGGGSATIAEVPDHEHPKSTIDVWMPNINDVVLVLYLPGDDSDGFILGGIL